MILPLFEADLEKITLLRNYYKNALPRKVKTGDKERLELAIPTIQNLRIQQLYPQIIEMKKSKTFSNNQIARELKISTTTVSKSLLILRENFYHGES